MYPCVQKMTDFGVRVYHFMLDVLFPPVCISCRTSINKQSDFLCRACFITISFNTGFLCPQCGGKRVHHTPCHHTPFVLAAACSYHDPLPAPIHHYKYARLEKLRTFLAALMITYARQVIPDITSYCITYIPLHPHRERTRGFNQSKELAHCVANYFHIPCFDLLSKSNDTEPQAQKKSYTQRVHNVHGCFRCINPHNISGKKIILVDDVCTSGATLWEASKTLWTAHPRRIIALTIAKAE